MKRTFTVNLNNTVYHIDNDAYELLQQYLQEVEERLSPDERQEVMADIEGRISELFTEKLQKGKDVINIQDVEEVINILGKPNQFSEESEDSEAKRSPKEPVKIKKKFYRDPDNSIFGGVAAGLAAFIGWDVIWVRILLVLILLLGWGTIIPIYLVAWLIVPPAKTISQKLEMQGKDVTAERIKTEINNLKTYIESDKFKESATGIENKLGEVFRVIFKVLFGLFGAIMGFIGFILLGVLLFVLAFVLFEPAVFSGFLPDLYLLSPTRAVWMLVSLLLITGIPVFMLIYWIIRIVTGRKKERSGGFIGMMILLWLAGIIVFAGLSAKTIINFDGTRFDNIEFFRWDVDETIVDEVRQLAPFNKLEVSGNIELELIQDSEPMVQISSYPSLLALLITEVDDRGVLRLYTDRFQVHGPIKVKVGTDVFSEIVAEGVCELNASRKITADRLKIDLSGWSRAKLDLGVAQDLEVNLSGASKAELAGYSYVLHTNVSGGSKLRADDLLVKNARVMGSGAAKIKINVSDSLFVDLSGASSFKAEKKPLYVEQYKSGTSLIRIED